MSRAALVALLLVPAGCWELAGVEDRELSCPSVFSGSVSAACAQCLEQSCCGELGDCAQSQACRECTVPSNGSYGCSLPSEYTALESCVNGSCGEECATGVFPGAPGPYCNALYLPSGGVCGAAGGFEGRLRCNPLTNEGCAGGDEVCALDLGTLTWTCRATGHAIAICKPCGVVEGDCALGNLCANGQCYRYCCEDGDCAPLGRCQRYDETQSDLGVCFAE